MEEPKSVKFAGIELEVEKLSDGSSRGPMDRNWTRVEFPIPSTYDIPDKIRDWIMNNAIHHWAFYTYSSPKDNTNQMVIRFQDRNDALMFKLKGGHQIWEA